MPGNVFVRHDWFDPNAESAAQDYWRRTALGWYKDFTRNVRITAEYDIVANSLTKTHDNTYGLQVQTRF
jgi:hypothetical protein